MRNFSAILTENFVLRGGFLEWAKKEKNRECPVFCGSSSFLRGKAPFCPMPLIYFYSDLSAVRLKCSQFLKYKKKGLALFFYGQKVNLKRWMDRSKNQKRRKESAKFRNGAKTKNWKGPIRRYFLRGQDPFRQTVLMN